MRLVALVILSSCLSACGSASRPELGPFFFVDHAEEAEQWLMPSARPSSPDRPLSAPMTLGEETRVSLTPPLGSRLTFSLALPSNPTLRFGLGLLALDPSVTAKNTEGPWSIMRRVNFSIHIESGGVYETVFSESLHRHEVGRWLDKEVDLSAWADSTIELTLETLPPVRFRGRPNDQKASALSQYLTLWGNPVLVDGNRTHVPRKIVLISIDCLRADHVGALGYPRDTTPNIDRFAEDGVVFTSAVTNAPSTLPSHTSMFTGLTPSLHGASKWRKLDRAVPYLPELLSQKGILTDGVVSGPYLSQWFGFERGFHSYIAKSDPPADTTIDAAIEALHRGEGMDQFLFIHLFDPHWPYFPAADLIERFGDRPPDISDLLDLVKRRREPSTPQEIQLIANLYDAEIAQADRAIGRFLDELRSAGLYDESLIIVTADHGEAFYEHDHWQHSVSLYEELLRVPLIVKWPGRSLLGKSDALVSHIDIFPTILNEVGIKESSLSSRAGLRNFAAGQEYGGEREVLSEFQWLLDDQTRIKISFRTPELKYIATVSIPPGRDASLDMLHEEELYNLASDPGEQRNISSTKPEAIQAFQHMLFDYLKRSQSIRSSARGEEVTLDEATKKQLRELGYVHE